MPVETPVDNSDLEAEQPESYKRATRIDWVLIALIGLLFQAFWVRQLTQPTYMDAYYYATNGQRLAGGYGFTEMIIWQFLDDPVGLPAPSHTYWMPLPSILAAAGYALRDDFSGAQLLFWLLGGLLPLLAYTISRQLTGQRWQAWVAALFTAVGGYYAAFLGQPSTFAPFAWTGGVCLLALGLATAYQRSSDPSVPAARVMRRSRRRWWWLVAGLTAGLAHLTRADGFLLLLVALLVWFFEARSWWLDSRKRRISPPLDESAGRQSQGRSRFLGYLALLMLGYFLIMGWWFARNWLVLGRPLSTAGTQSAFLTTYDDLFAYGRVNDLQGFFAWGWQNILRSRLQGAWLGIQTLVVIPGLIFLVPFILAALVSFYRRTTSRLLIRPMVIYTVALFISAAFVFTLPGMRGSLFHSSVALWPWSTALAAAGIGLSVDWVAARLSHWQPERAKLIFSGLFIIMALLFTFFVSQVRLSPDEDPDAYRQVGAVVPSSSVIMAGNAPALHYYTGLPAISVPNEPVGIVVQAADRYGVTHVMLNENRPRPLADFYQGAEKHPRLQLVWTSDGTNLYELLNEPK